MYHKVINTILIFIACQGIGLAQTFPFDTSKSNIFSGNIIIKCVPLVDNIPITENDFILVCQDDSIIGYKRYIPPDSITIIPTFNEIKKDSAITYSIFRMGNDTCIITDIEIDTIEITTEIDTREIVTYMFATTGYIYYPKDKICINDTIAPIISRGIYIDDISFSSNSGLYVDQQGTIYPSESDAWEGIHELIIESGYCLLNKSIDITVVEPLINTESYNNLTICQNTSIEEIIDQDTMYFQNYILDSITSTFDSTNKLINTKYEIFSTDINECKTHQEIYVNYIIPQPVNVHQEYFCDKTILNIEEPSLFNTYNWSNGDSDEIIEIYSDTVITLSTVDNNDCSNNTIVDVSIKSLEIISLDYSVEASSCWEFGKIDLIDNTNKFGYSPYRYVLRNTLNNKLENDITRIPEGIYRLSVIDSRNCQAEYDNDIIVKQDCLNDYPVFTPNEDGNEDEYFISHEGNIKIYDRNGKLLKDMKTPAYWDGKDDRGSTVPMGNYLIVTDKGKVVNITVIR